MIYNIFVFTSGDTPVIVIRWIAAGHQVTMADLLGAVNKSNKFKGRPICEEDRFYMGGKSITLVTPLVMNDRIVVRRTSREELA